jgi:polyferredoxin
VKKGTVDNENGNVDCNHTLACCTGADVNQLCFNIYQNRLSNHQNSSPTLLACNLGITPSG